MRIALYARVSTRGQSQDTENQMVKLREYCAGKEGYEIVREYVDHASGSKSDREEFTRMFAEAELREFDMVLFWALDRFSREGALQTLNHLQRLTECQVRWKSLTERYLDSAGIFKDAIISIMATLARQERIRIQERVNAGLDRARAKGVKLGRPQLIVDREKVREYYSTHKSLRKAAAKFSVSKDVIAQIVKESR